MKRFFLLFIFALICGMLYTSCSSDMQGEIAVEPQEELTEVQSRADSEASEDGTTDEPEEEITEVLKGAIAYPKYGKFGLPNILADDFAAATKTENKLVEYSLSADVPVGAGLKIVIKTKSADKLATWGGFYGSSVENWHVTNWDDTLRGNTMTVYESGKIAHAIVTFNSDCIIEYYENGAETPTKVKEIKVSNDIVTEDPQAPDTENMQGVIIYPKTGKYGLPNILADGFVQATKTEFKLVEYSINAEVPVGAGLKIVIKSTAEPEPVRFEQPDAPAFIIPWGGFYPDTAENWRITNWDDALKGNTFTVWESGKTANVTITFTHDCIIEYYENGAKTPTKVKEIKVVQ